MLAAARAPLAHRYFFALLPDAVTARRIHAFAERTFGEKGLMRPERLHVTLAITADFDGPDEAVLAALLRAGDRVAAAPFEMSLDRLSGSRRTMALRPSHTVPALRALQTHIAVAMTKENEPTRPDWTFSPHLTLVYRDGEPVTKAMEAFSWRVRDFVLIESLVGMRRHIVRGHWRLEAQSDAQGTLF